MMSSTEWNLLRQFTREVLAVCDADDTGVTESLYDLALNAAEILQMQEAIIRDSEEIDDGA